MTIVCRGTHLPARYSLRSFILLVAAIGWCLPAIGRPAVAAAPDDPLAPYLDGKSPEIVRDVAAPGPAPDGVTVRRVVFRSRDASEIYAVIATPTTPGKHPGMLVLHGGGGAAEADKAIAWAQRGYVSVAPDLPGIAEPKKLLESNGRWKNLKYGEGRWVAKPDVSASVIFDAVLAAMKSLYLLRAQPDVDAAHIGVVGISWGGYMTTMVCGLAGDAVQAGFAVYGCGFYELTAQNDTTLAKMPPDERALWLEHLDPGRRAPGIRAAYFNAGAANDFFYWPPAVQATLDAIPGEKNHLFAPNASHKVPLPGGTGGSKANWLAMEVPFFEYHLKGIGRPLPKISLETRSEGRAARFKIAAPQPITTVEVYWSATDPAWNKRPWTAVAAVKRADDVYEAQLPAVGLDWFAVASDARPVTVSSDLVHWEASGEPQPATAPSGSAKVDDRMFFAATDWPWWRGPDRDGIARADQKLPTTWGETQNVLWKTEVPGRGHASPTVVGNCVYLPTADEPSGSQSVLCFDRATGKQLWQTEVHAQGGMRKNEKSSAASSSVACDHERLFICFANSGAVFATALDRGGKQLWQTRFSDYLIHQGYASSPAVYQSVVLVSADHKGGGAMAALDRSSGKIVWKQPRPPAPNYTSPILLHLAGRDQVLLTGCDQVVSYDPLAGKVLWEATGATTECVTSTVSDGKHVFTSGGYPRNHTAAMLADGSGKIAWENKNRIYVPSLLVRDGFLFGVLDAGVAGCWKSDTGEEMWKARLGGNFSASPVLAGDRIYAANEIGETYVYRANSDKFEQLAVNRLGDEAFATPTICGSRIYLRVAHHVGGRRQEMLYCLGQPN